MVLFKSVNFPTNLFLLLFVCHLKILTHHVVVNVFLSEQTTTKYILTSVASLPYVFSSWKLCVLLKSLENHMGPSFQVQSTVFSTLFILIYVFFCIIKYPDWKVLLKSHEQTMLFCMIICFKNRSHFIIRFYSLHIITGKKGGSPFTIMLFVLRRFVKYIYILCILLYWTETWIKFLNCHNYYFVLKHYQ